MYKKHVKNIVPDKIEISEMEKSIKTILSKEKKIENKMCIWSRRKHQSSSSDL